MLHALGMVQDALADAEALIGGWGFFDDGVDRCICGGGGGGVDK